MASRTTPTPVALPRWRPRGGHRASLRVSSSVAALACALAGAQCHRGPAPPKPATATPADAEAPPPMATLADAAAIRAQGDAAWPQRDGRAALDTALAAYEQAYAMAPTDVALATRLAHGYALLVRAHLTPAGDRAGMQRASARAVAVGEMALRSSSPAFAGHLQNEGPIEGAIALLAADSVPALCAYVEALGVYASCRNQSTALFYAQRLRSCIERLLALDERFAAALPHRYMALWFSHVPAFVGGSTARARVHFRQALALSQNAPVNLVAYAKFADNNAKERTALARALVLAVDSPNEAPGPAASVAAAAADESVWGDAEKRVALREARALVDAKR